MKRQLALLVASTVLIGSVVGGLTYAFFTASAGPTTSSFASGTLNFTIDAMNPGIESVGPTAIISANNMAPGDSREAIATVHSTGTLDLIYRFDVINENVGEGRLPNDGTFEDWLHLQFFRWTPSATGTETFNSVSGNWLEFGSVSRYPGQTVTTRTLHEWYTDPATPDYQGELTAGGIEYLKIKGTLPLETPNQAQGGKGVFGIQAHASQKKNAGLTGSYYAVNNPSNGPAPGQVPFLRRADPTVDFDWDDTNVAAGGPHDNIYVSWDGKLVIKDGGNYSFRTLSDDGVAVQINGAQVISNWSDHGRTYDSSGSIHFDPGTYDFHMQLFERWGQMAAKLEWQTPGSSSWTTVPQEAFSYN